MATINYNGMELEEFTSDKPVAFSEGTKAICWDSNEYKDGFWSLLDIIAFIPYLKDPVLTRDYLNDSQDSPYRHCALLPDPPKPRRATWLEVARWCATGNGLVYDTDRDKIDTGIMFKPSNEHEPIMDEIRVRKWSDTEWHEPDVESLGRND